MKFKVIVNTIGNFNLEALVRAMDTNARLTKSGWTVCWLTRKEIDRLEDWHAEYRVLY